MSTCLCDRGAEPRFEAVFGSQRGNASASADTDNAESVCEESIVLERLCLDCGNIPYEDEHGWHGHDEDCASIGEGGHVLPNACSDCAQPISGRRGHSRGCSQPQALPDYYDRDFDLDSEV
jgi:hypothetical protein